MTDKITLKDGSTINAEVNGTCYIVDTKPEFPADLSVVEVETTDGDRVETRTLHNVRIIEPFAIDNRDWFGFYELSAQELWQASIEDAICELSEVM